MRRRRMGCPTSSVGDEGAVGGLAECDPGGAEVDAGGDGAVAGRESAEGLGTEGVQAGGASRWSG